MSNLHAFFAQNVEKVQVEEHVISNRFKDENGNPIKWQFGAIDGMKDTENRAAATKKVPMYNNPNVKLPETDFDLYILKNAVDSIKFPNLKDAELQKSYGVMCGEELLQKMLLPGELTEVKRITQEVNGFNAGITEMVEEAKN